MSPTIDRDDGSEIELSVSFAPKDEDVFAENRAELVTPLHVCSRKFLQNCNFNFQNE